MVVVVVVALIGQFLLGDLNYRLSKLAPSVALWHIARSGELQLREGGTREVVVGGGGRSSSRGVNDDEEEEMVAMGLPHRMKSDGSMDDIWRVSAQPSQSYSSDEADDMMTAAALQRRRMWMREKYLAFHEFGNQTTENLLLQADGTITTTTTTPTPMTFEKKGTPIQGLVETSSSGSSSSKNNGASEVCTVTFGGPSTTTPPPEEMTVGGIHPLGGYHHHHVRFFDNPGHKKREEEKGHSGGMVISPSSKSSSSSSSSSSDASSSSGSDNQLSSWNLKSFFTRAIDLFKIMPGKGESNVGSKRQETLAQNGANNRWGWVVHYDELINEMALGEIFLGFKEGPLSFPPTYRWRPKTYGGGFDQVCMFM